MAQLAEMPIIKGVQGIFPNYPQLFGISPKFDFLNEAQNKITNMQISSAFFGSV